MTPTQSIEKELGVKVAGWHIVDPAALDDALAKCARQPLTWQPIGYIAWRNGAPSWDEDCVCKDPVYPVDADDDRTSRRIYVAPVHPRDQQHIPHCEGGKDYCPQCAATNQPQDTPESRAWDEAYGIRK